MNLENRVWKEFLFPDIFIIKKGFYNKKPRQTSQGEYPFLGATENSNGITGFSSFEDIENGSRLGFGKNEPIEKKIFKGNCIAVTNNGSVGHAFYQVTDFTCSHDINPLYLRERELDRHLAMFLVTQIEKQKVCFEYARKWRPSRMVKSKLLLPVDGENNPDWDFMTNLMKDQEKKILDRYEKHLESLKITWEKTVDVLVSIEEKEWGEFFVEDIAEILSGRDIYEAERRAGNTPYISATANNNGIGYFVGNENSSKEAGCLSVNRNGSVGYSFYHEYEALFSNDCRKLRLKNPNKHVGIFISQQITRQRGKYGYGYKMGTARLKRQKILLPINEIHEPDYAYMESYIKSIEVKKLNAYVDYLKRKVVLA